MSAHPVLVAAALVAALGSEVNIVVSGVEQIDAPRIRGIRMEHAALLVFEEYTDSGVLRTAGILSLEIVEGLFLGHLFRCERNVVVEIEIVFVGREPFEIPAHAFFVGCQLAIWRARDRDHGGVAMVDVDDVAVEAVSPERAMLASRVPTGVEHKMVDDQLAAPVEEFRQRLLTVRTIEDVGFGNRLPRKLAPLLVQLVAQPREFLFLGEKCRARGQPFFVGDDAMTAQAAALRCHGLPLQTGSIDKTGTTFYSAGRSCD